MAMDGEAADGTLYRFDPDRRWHALDSGCRVTNGPAFNPAQDQLYHADNPNRVVYRFGLDDSGALSNKTRFVGVPDDWGFPDGMTLDAAGFLWVAHWDSGRVSRFDPDGRLERAIALPASRITSCAFGGPALDQLFVTSASEGCPHDPLAGYLSLRRVSAGAGGRICRMTPVSRVFPQHCHHWL